MNKQELRKEYLTKRSEMLSYKKREMELEIQARLLMSSEYRNAEQVLLYVSKDKEIDTFGIINAAFANKKRVAVPVTNDDFSLSFYYINSTEELKIGKFGVLEPIEQTNPVVDFSGSICVVPCLCCDLRGMRLGYGKGCYDRFLSTYDGVKICLCYSDDILPYIENDDNDVAMDVIISNGYIKHT